MKNLSEYITNKHFNNPTYQESKTDGMLKLNFVGIDGGADLVTSIKSIASSNVITYSSDSQEDVKLKLDPSKISGFEKIVEVLTEFINSISAEEHDNIGEELEKINANIDKLQDWIDEQTEQANATEAPTEAPDENSK